MAMLEELFQQNEASPYPPESLLGAITQRRPADPLRSLRDMIPQNKDGGLSMLNMIREALGTSANWLDGTKDPSLIGTQEMVSPLGLMGMAGPMSGALRRGGAAAMADNAKGSAPGTVVNSLDMSEAARMARAKEQGFGEQTYYHGTPDKFDEFQASPHGQFGAGVYASPSKAHASRFGDVMDLKVRGPVATWADIPEDVGKRGFIQQLFQKTTPSQDAAMWARENGFSGFTPEKGGSSAVIFDPRNIRSTQAAFDPAKRDSAMLLAADNAKGSAPGTVMNSFAEGGRRGGPAIEEVWGTKFQTHMSKEYEKAVAGGDLSTQFDILSAKYANSLSDSPEIRAAMKAEMDRIEPQVRADEAALREELRQRFGSPPKLLADNAKGSAPGTVLNSMAEGGAAARLKQAMGNEDAFRVELQGLQGMSVPELKALAAEFTGAPAHAIRNKTDALDMIMKRHRNLMDSRAKAEFIKGFGTIEASPSASAPGLAANSTQQQTPEDQPQESGPRAPPVVGETPGRPMMPEDMAPPSLNFGALLQALGAGAVDPFGLTGRGLQAMGFEHPARRLSEMRAEYPTIADMGGVLGPGGALGKAGGMALKEFAPHLLGLAGQVPILSGIVRDATGNTLQPAPRAQAGYPREGAY